MSGVVSVGVAVGAAAFAATDIAAAGGLTVATALEATAAVGAAVGAVGTVTGNKALQIAGLALGVVGGVGALASSAGLLGADAITAGATGTGMGAGEMAGQVAATQAAGLGAGAAAETRQHRFNRAWASSRRERTSTTSITSWTGSGDRPRPSTLTPSRWWRRSTRYWQMPWPGMTPSGRPRRWPRSRPLEPPCSVCPALADSIPARRRSTSWKDQAHVPRRPRSH
jgi:hypothetical protein